jgi:tetratricopeptide (TPR) repeat protein
MAEVDHARRALKEHEGFLLIKESLQEYGLEVGKGDPAAAVVLIDRRPGEVRPRVVAALDLCMGHAPKEATKERQWLESVLHGVDPDPWRQRVRRALNGDPRERPFSGLAERRGAALVELAGQARVDRQKPTFLILLASHLPKQAVRSRIDLLRRAQRHYPGDFWVNLQLASYLGASVSPRGADREATPQQKPVVEEAIRFGMVARALRPDNPVAHHNLGGTLHLKGDLEGAIACLEKAISLDPKFADAHFSLGLVLQARGDLEGAIARFRQALLLDPKFAPAYSNLGACLGKKGDWKDAIACVKKAIDLDRKMAPAHSNLGIILAEKGDLKGAIACYEEAIRLDPKHVGAHIGLGNALITKGNLEGALAEFKHAIKLSPNEPLAHYGLGNAHKERGDLEGALAEFKAALRLDPKLAAGHLALGFCLEAKGDVAGAIAAFRRATQIDPQFAQAHSALATALLRQGDFAAARDATRRCLEVLPAGHPRREYVSQQLRRCERVLALDARLPTYLEGKIAPRDAEEQIDLALLCQRPSRQLYRASARFFAAAFAARPGLANGYGEHAACAAVMAAAGQGKDGGKLDDRERAHLRQQALAWLRANLAAGARWMKEAPKNRPAFRLTLDRWRKTSFLAGVRDSRALANLPEDERAAWFELWAEVDRLMRRP